MVDNSTDFEQKINRVIERVCKGMRKRGAELEVEDRLKAQSKKRKFLIKSLPDLKASRNALELCIMLFPCLYNHKIYN